MQGIWTHVFAFRGGLAALGGCTLVGPLLCLAFGWRRKGSLPRVVGAYGASVALVTVGLFFVHRDLLHAYVHLAVDLAMPFELAFALWVVVAALRATRGLAQDKTHGDFHARIDAVVEQAAGPGRLAAIVAGEISVLYYGIFSWRARPAVTTGATPFSCAERGGYGGALPAVLALLVLETTVAHVLLSPHLPKVAWAITFSGLYAGLWVVADVRAVHLRPILVSRDTILIRAGLRGTMRLPVSSIRNVYAGTAAAPIRPRSDYVRVNVLGRPDFTVELSDVATLRGPFGAKRAVSRIGFSVDDPVAFEASLQALDLQVSGRVHPSQGDFFDQVRSGLRGLLHSPAVADALAREMGLLAYALSFSRRRAPRHDSGASEFSIHRKGSYGLVIGTLMFVSCIEMGAVDLLVRHASVAAANVLLVVGAYAIIWFWGDYKAVASRPFLIDDGALVVRVGLRKEARIPLADIEQIDPAATAAEPKGERDYVRCTAFGPPDTILQLRRPAQFEQLFGRIRMAARVGVAVDDESAFDKSLRARVGRAPVDESAGGRPESM